MPQGRSALTRSAYQEAGTPGGSDPDSTTQSARSDSRTIRSASFSIVAASRVGPGSFNFVVVPSASVRVMFIRTRSPICTIR